MLRKSSFGAILIALIISMFTLAAPAANAADADTTKLEVKTWSVGEASSDAEITNETRLVIDGATQVSWEVPDHNVNVSKKKLKKAPRIKVNATGANSSKVIYKTAKKKLFKKYKKTMPRAKAKKLAVRHSGVVVLKSGSEVRNTGRENKLRVGFPWRLAFDGVMVFDKASGQYRHAYNLRDGKLIKTCLNYIGGNVPMRDKVVQVRYEEDVEYGGHIKAVAKAPVSVEFMLTCPNGAAFKVNAWAEAYGLAESYVTFTARTRVQTKEDFKLRAKQNIAISQDVFASASAGINVEATCGPGTPPPPPPCTEKCEEPATPAPRADGPTVNDVLVNNERDMTFTGKLAKGTTGKASASAGTGTIVSNSRVNLVTDADGYFTVTFRYRAGDEPGRDTVTLVVDQSDGQSVTTTTMGRDAAGNLVPHFEVRAAPIDPM